MGAGGELGLGRRDAGSPCCRDLETALFLVKGLHPKGKRAFRPDAFSEIINRKIRSETEKRQMEKTLEKVSFQQFSAPACPLELGSGAIN